MGGRSVPEQMPNTHALVETYSGTCPLLLNTESGVRGGTGMSAYVRYSYPDLPTASRGPVGIA